VPALAATLAVTLAGTVAGCGSLGDAQQVIDRSRLVNDLASRLDSASTQTYTADYQLADGQRASIAQAQKPVRASYAYPGGKYATTNLATVDCQAGPRPSCTLTLPPTPNADSDVESGLLPRLRDHGVVPPTLVIGLLAAASLSPNAVVRQHDTTIAGEHASCVDVSGVANAAASTFDACITTSGVLGSFHGTVDGRPMDVSLVRYATTVAPDAFDPLSGATVVDQRPPGFDPKR